MATQHVVHTTSATKARQQWAGENEKPQLWQEISRREGLLDLQSELVPVFLRPLDWEPKSGKYCLCAQTHDYDAGEGWRTFHVSKVPGSTSECLNSHWL